MGLKFEGRHTHQQWRLKSLLILHGHLDWGYTGAENENVWLQKAKLCWPHYFTTSHWGQLWSGNTKKIDVQIPAKIVTNGFAVYLRAAICWERLKIMSFSIVDTACRLCISQCLRDFPVYPVQTKHIPLMKIDVCPILGMAGWSKIVQKSSLC